MTMREITRRFYSNDVENFSDNDDYNDGMAGVIMIRDGNFPFHKIT